MELIRIGLVLQLSAPYIDDLLEKGNVGFVGVVNGDMVILKTIIYSYPRCGLIEIYKALKRKNLERLLELRPEWVEKNKKKLEI